MNNQWRSAEWVSDERAEPKRTLRCVVKPYVKYLVSVPVTIHIKVITSFIWLLFTVTVVGYSIIEAVVSLF